MTSANDDVLSDAPAGWSLYTGNLHIYRFFGANIVGGVARTEAASQISGASYLATVTSGGENAFLDTLTGSNWAHLGGDDLATPGTWRWTTGAEAGQTFYDVETGTAAGAFVNWASGQPSGTDGLGLGEHFVIMRPDGLWNDVNESNNSQLFVGYVAEAGAPGSLYASVNEDNAFMFVAAALLANDGTGATFQSVNAVSSKGARLVYDSGTGNLTYDPTHASALQNLGGGQSTTDTFTYTFVKDGTPKTATVTLTVSGLADTGAWPVPTADSYTTAKNTALTINAASGVLANDTDADTAAGSLSAIKVGDPTHGTLTLNANGSFTYTPASGYSGADSFTYQVSDGTHTSEVTTVNLTVTEGPMPNTAPQFVIGDGKVTTPVGTGNDFAYSVVVQPDGKIVAAGYGVVGGSNDFALVRYNADGSLDTSFGAGDGIATTNVLGTDLAFGVTLQPNGMILVAGRADPSLGAVDFALVRYKSDGSLDTDFGGGDGIVTTGISGIDVAQSVTTQPDGKILVAGWTDPGSGNADFALVRYNADGSLDTTFDGDGKVTTGIGASTSIDTSHPVALQTDGKILVAGPNLIRYNADGSLDTSFDGDGKVATAFSHVFSAMLQPDGKIVVAGYSNSNQDFAVARYNADGSLDTNFGGSGSVTTSIVAQTDEGFSAALQPDGKIVVAGMAFTGSAYAFALARYNADGSLDSGFGGGDGTVTTNIRSFDDRAFSVAIQPDGKIVVAGASASTVGALPFPEIPTGYDFALVRYNADGSLDTTFDGTNTVNPTAAYTEGAAPVVLSPNITITDDGTTLARATVHIAGGFAGSDDVLDANVAGTGITKSWNATTGTLTLSGADTLAHYQQVLRTVTYQSTSSEPTDHGAYPTRTIEWQVFDSNTANATPLGTKTSLTTATGVYDGKLADLNGDGKLDLIYSQSDQTQVFVAFGDGTGAFGPQTAYTAGSGVRGVTIADFDRDGDLDLLVSLSIGSKLALLTNNGAGSFAAAQVVGSTTGTPGRTVTGDFNRDGKLDVIATGGLLPGNGDGTFGTQIPISGLPTLSQIVTGDFNNDGKLDFAAVASSAGNVTVFAGNGDGTFATGVAYPVGGTSQRMSVGDIDNDGDLDLVATSVNNGAISLLLNSGTGTFTTSTISGIPTIGDIKLADYDGDGKLDIVVASFTSLRVYHGNGDGTFASVQTVANAAGFIVSGDLNGDGALDIVSLDITGTASSILLNTSTNQSAIADTVVTVTDAVPPTPSLSAAATASFTENGSAVVLSPSLTLSDDGTTLAFATVRIAEGYFPGSGDVLAATTTGTSITASYNAANGTLTLTGTDTLAHYQQVLRTVSYVTASDDPTEHGAYPTRTIEWQVSDGTAAPTTVFQAATTVTLSVSNHLADVLADVNGDGTPDLIYDGIGGSSVYVAFGNGAGSFGASTTYGGFGVPTLGLIAVDLDGDGDRDIVVANDTFSYSVLRNDGVGNFTTPSGVSIGGASAFASGDFNRDGKIDLVVTRGVSGNAQLIRGNGDGTFGAPSSVGAGSGALALAAADFNNDGKLDVALGGTNKVDLVLGDGNGGFGAATTMPINGGGAVRGLAAVDFNNDGRLDIAVVEPTGFSILIQNANGSFTATDIAAGVSLLGIAVGDFNGDGNVDAAGSSSDGIRLLRGNGNGTFQPVQTYAAGTAFSSIAAADINGDGVTDLIGSQSVSANEIILLGAATNLSATQTTALSITATNDPTTIMGLPTSLSFTEDTSGNINLSGATVADPDATLIDLRLSVSSGTLLADGTPFGSSLILNNTPAGLTSYLGNPSHLSYAPAANLNGPVTLTISANDGSGYVQIGTVTLNVAAVNDPPTLGATPLNPTVAEDTISVNAPALFSGAAISTVESGQTIDRITLTASNLAAGDQLRIDGFAFSLGLSGTLGAVGTPANGIVIDLAPSGGMTTITLTRAGGMPPALAQDVINGAAFFSASQDPAGQRVFTITSIRDSGGSEISTPNIVSTVTLLAENDAPVLQNLQADQVTFTEDGPAVLLDAGTAATVTDVDAADFAGGSLTVSITSGRIAAEDVLGIKTIGTGAGQINVSGSNVLYGSTVIGTFTGGTGTDNLVISLNAAADPTNVAALIQAMTYANANTANPGIADRLVRVTIDDGDGGSGFSSVLVHVAAANDGPVALADTYAVTEDTPLTIAARGVLANDSDLDGNPLTAIKVSDPSHGTLTLNANGSFTYTPDANYNGPDSFSYKANDGTTDSNTVVVTLDVGAVNDPPAVTTVIPDQSIDEDTAWNFQFAADTFGDPDSSLTYTATLDNGAALPDWIVFNGAARTFSGTPPLDSAGFLDIKVTASDGVASAADTFRLTVGAVNDPPVVANAIADQSVKEDTAWNFQFASNAFTDPDSGTLTYTASLDSGALLPDWITFNATTRTFSGTPPTNFNGAIALKVTASDGLLSVSDSFNLTVTPVNDAPTLTGTPRNGTYVENAPSVPTLFYSPTVAISTVESDQKIDRITLTITGLVDGASERFVADGYHFMLGNSQVLTTPTSGITVDIAKSGTTANITLSKAGGMAVADAENLVRFLGLYTGSENPTAGNRVMTITSIRDTGGTADGGQNTTNYSLSSTFTIQPVNDAPTVGNNKVLSVDEGRVRTILAGDLDFNDVDNTDAQITYTLVTRPAHGTLWLDADGDSNLDSGEELTVGGTFTQANINSPSRLKYTHDGSETTSDSFGFDVTDGANGAVTGQTFVFTIAPINDRPTVAAPIADQSSPEDSLWTFQFPAGAFADAEGTALTYTATLGSGAILPTWLSFDGPTRTFSGRPPANFNGQIDVKVTASDGTWTVSDTFSLAVTAVADAPTGTVTIGGTPTQGATLTASDNLADPDGLGQITYHWQRDGSEVATGTQYVLTEEDVGAVITVVAKYVDGLGTAEQVTSDPTAVVTNVNEAPTGSVTIGGTATQGATLTASDNLADGDGLGTIVYHWQRDGSEVATGTQYLLTEDDVGAVITVVAKYTDGHGTAEQIASDPTGAVTNANDAPTGAVTIGGTATQGATLTASDNLADPDGLGPIIYHWQRDGSEVATGTQYLLTEDDVGAVITVVAKYTDGHGTAEQVTSAPTAAVTNANDAPTGTVTIGGTATQGATLTASDNVADGDGLGTITYHWQRDGSEVATGTQYLLTEDDVGAVITVVAKYTDGHGTAEQVASDPTAVVTNVNEAPIGSVTIGGTATQGATLTASDNLADGDGLGTIVYHWQRDGSEMATGATYTLTEDDVGAVVTVVAKYTDGHGTAEQITSDPTAVVTNANDAPTGTVSIGGTATQGATLTASDNLADADGLGQITYHWQRDGSEVATGTQYALTEDDVGAVITVVAKYTDRHGTAEQVSSDPTAAVTNANDAPTGTVTIGGTATQGATLTASDNVADADGLGPIIYHWQRDGSEVATGTQYVLTEDDVGAVITVVAKYTDGHGTAEEVTSDPTAEVTNKNDAPTGTVTIGGTATQGATLTASDNLADTDGLGTIVYHWQRDGSEIATGAQYVLTEDDVGAVVTVVAKYTDGHGTAEQVTSDPTGTVTNANDAPTGAVTIGGTATQGATLTASDSLADADGLGLITYHWQHDGSEIATGTQYLLTEDDVGAVITVVAKYTDGHGAAEQVTSDPTAVVTNANDAPKGTVSIGGTATQGATLTASDNLVDPDGLGAITYHWKRDGSEIAAGATYTLTEDDVGAVITVVAKYTDGHGTAEQVTSDPTAAVTNANDLPTGTVSIGGTAAQGATLTASDNLADADGLGPIIYHWQRDGSEIATGTQYVLTEDDVGAVITVVAKYTDRHGTAEQVKSAPTAAVANVDDAPVAVADTAVVDQDSAVAIDVLANDADIDGGPRSVTAITQGVHGTVVITDGGAGLTYKPGAGYFGADSFTYALNGGSVATVTVTVNQVVAANSIPVVHHNTGSTVTEGGSDAVTAAEIDFDDAEQADSAVTYTITAETTQGTLFRNGVALALGASFTQADINNGLIAYTHGGGEAASDAFGFIVSDGAGGVTSGQTFAFAVAGVNDAPVNTVPGTQEVEANTSTAIAGLSIADADAGTAAMTTTLSVAHGTLTVAAVGGAAVSGSGTGTVTLTGTQAQINAALAANNVIYAGLHDFFGTDTLTMTTNDGGNSGAGGPGSDTDHVAINLNTLITGTPNDDSYDALPGNARIDALGGVDTITFSFRLVDAAVSYVGNTVIIDGPSGSHTVLTGFERYVFSDGVVENNDGSPLIDDLFYYSKYHDVWTAHVDADAHYNSFGWHEGRDPNAFFQTQTYLWANPDVKAAGVNPLDHFTNNGWAEGRSPSIAFETGQYLAANPDVAAAGIDPLRHYLEFGYQEGRQPLAPAAPIAANGFDYTYYLANNPDVAAAGIDPFLHFETIGWQQGRNPNAVFDTRAYLEAYTDVRDANINPLDHYSLFGWHEGRDPSVDFDTTSYLEANADVAAAGINPLTHFLQYGLHEGRSPFADGHFG